jgi:hypothetical protein
LPDLLGQSQTSLASLVGTRAWDWVYYVGPSLSKETSASGANLNRILTNLSPGSSTVLKYFNNTWNAASTVKQTDPYSWTDLRTNATVTTTQVDNPANYVGWTSGPVNWLSASSPSDYASLVTGGNRQKFIDNSQGFTWQGYLLGGNLVPTFGWRRDNVINYDTNAALNSSTGTAALDYQLNPASYRSASGQSRNWSGVYHIPREWVSKVAPGASISLLYNESSNFKADAPRRNLMGNVIDNPQGKTREKGVIVGVMNDRLTLRANWYKTTTTNATLASGATAIFGGGNYLMYRNAVFGYMSAALIQDHMKGWDDSQSVSDGFASWFNYAAADGVAGVKTTDNFTNTSASSPYQTAAQTVNSVKMINAWLNLPSFMDKAFYTFWNVSVPFDPAKGKASGILHDTFGGINSTFTNLLTTINALNPSASTLPVTTVDTISQGSEFEFMAHPVKNWDVSLNYVRTRATRTNLDGATRTYMDAMNTFYNGDAGYLRMFGVNDPSQIVKSAWNNQAWKSYQVILSSQGQSAPEVSPWRLNLVNNYKFEQGRLKGFAIGGAARIEAARISGYKYSAALGYLDVNQTVMGPEDKHFDLWVGYTKQLKHNVVWHAQFNIRNVGEKTRLLPSYYEPDGSLSLARIQEGSVFRFANSLEF